VFFLKRTKTCFFTKKLKNGYKEKKQKQEGYFKKTGFSLP